MKVAIVGAGFSGIITAKTLLEFGHEVVVFERCPDVGGVWSSTRRYPGLTTQNNKETYYLSDLPMPSHYPDWPSGEQVQEYLDGYVDKHDLRRVIRFETSVVGAETLEGNSGWRITSRRTAYDGNPEYISEDFHHLVVCNGVFSDGLIPEYPGRNVFQGTIVHSSQLLEPNITHNKHVIIVGYGKSSCDLAYAVSSIATSTTIVARRLLWKLPRKILGLPYKYLLLTRFGESLFEYIRPGIVERILTSRWGSIIRNGMLDSLQLVITRQLRLHETKLVPPGRFEDIARATISLSTEGFYDGVAAGRVGVIRDAVITRLDQNVAVLSNGDKIPCDLVVCATGFLQRAPFLPPNIQSQLVDARGNWLLYKRVLPIGVLNLSFNGYNSSLFCPTSAEATALFVAAHLAGRLPLPSEENQIQEVQEDLAWIEKRSAGKHAHNTSIVPFSLHTIDELLEMVGVNISFWAWLRQWFLPVRPSDYAELSRVLRSKISSSTST